ncbi:MAG TPA: hypothetical protein PKB02_16455 [Anaerohalosphaeraceae bacterium]|nr:hypothetical protein [Anaerohalosphaeraceae bacterium]
MLLICLFLLLFTRLIWTISQKKTRRFHVRLLLLILTCFAFYGGVKWPWCWSRREALHSGFLLRMQRKADVDAIRMWWEAVRDRYDVIDYINKSDWPRAIKDLNPSYVEVGRKTALPKYVSLTWSSFGGNYWGLNVGPKTMQCPLSQKDHIEQEECIPLVDGAHVFFISFD